MREEGGREGERREGEGSGAGICVRESVSLPFRVTVQEYLTHQKTHPPRTLP